MSTSVTDATESGRSRREDDVTLLARFVLRVSTVLLVSECRRSVADALKDSIAELRKDEGTRVSLYVHAKLFQSDGH